MRKRPQGINKGAKGVHVVVAEQTTQVAQLHFCDLSCPSLGHHILSDAIEPLWLEL